MTVFFTTASGGTFGTLGANYTLTDATGNSLTTSVVISAGRAASPSPSPPSTRRTTTHPPCPTLVLEPDATPTYHVGTPGQVAVAIRNNDRPPTVTVPVMYLATNINTALTLTMTASSPLWAPGPPPATHGVLQIKVTGHPRRHAPNPVRRGAAAVIATPGALFNPGDTLIWTPPPAPRPRRRRLHPLPPRTGPLSAALATRFRITVAYRTRKGCS